MKKILLSIAFALLGISSSFAAKAYSAPITVIQSDGTQLTIYLHGDEHNNWMTTADGALLQQVGNNYYIAEVTSAGKLKATKCLAHNANRRTTAEAKAIKNQDKQRFLSALDIQQSSAKGLRNIGTGNTAVKNTIKYFPHSGSPKALVILVEFSDTLFQSGEKAKNVFNHFLNAQSGDALPDGYEAYKGSYQHTNLRNRGSVSQYFTDMSQGKFTPQFDVVGPYQLSNTSLHYGQGKNDNAPALIRDACAAAYNNGVDFSQYDADGDGNVDLVYIIYAGYAGSMSGNNNDIWPKSGYCNSSDNGYCTYNGKHISRYGIHAELSHTWALNQANGYLISGIGLFCHEFSHTMGLPDLYPTVPASQVDNQSPEMWDLMDGGEYTYNGGYCPTPYSPWEMDAMGWTTPTELEDKEQSVSLESYDKNRLAYKIKAENNEYLLLQNIQQKGWWAGLARTYNSGLLVWRIDYDNKDVNLFDCPNNTVGKPKVMILPADGYVISSYNVISNDNSDAGKKWTEEQYKASLKGDPFPGLQNKTQLLNVALNKSTLEKPIYNIKETDGVITFDYLKDFTTGIDSPITNVEADKDANIYTLDGRYLGTDASKLGKGVYVIGKKKVVIK